MRLLPLLLLAACGAAQGWGYEGHREVGAVADALVKGKPAEAQVRRLLGAKETLSDAALWADCLKTVDGEATQACSPFSATPARAAEMAAFVRRNPRHRVFHYTDIAIQQPRYDEHFTGARPDDLLHAIDAAIARLQHRPQTLIAFADGVAGDREALRLLAHFIGDLHQPLHVGAIYLSPGGLPMNPDRTGHDPASDTVGGNVLRDGHELLHAEWDEVSRRTTATLLAVRVAANRGAFQRWPTGWAGETLSQAREAFAPVRFGAKAGREWPVLIADRAGYDQLRGRIQQQQLARAGRRLAQLLDAIWAAPR